MMWYIYIHTKTILKNALTSPLPRHCVQHHGGTGNGMSQAGKVWIWSSFIFPSPSTNLQDITGGFPKIVGFPPKSSILIGFSIIFTIHFGVAPIFGNTHLAPGVGSKTRGWIWYLLEPLGEDQRPQTHRSWGQKDRDDLLAWKLSKTCLPGPRCSFCFICLDVYKFCRCINVGMWASSLPSPHAKLSLVEAPTLCNLAEETPDLSQYLMNLLKAARAFDVSMMYNGWALVFSLWQNTSLIGLFDAAKWFFFCHGYVWQVLPHGELQQGPKKCRPYSAALFSYLFMYWRCQPGCSLNAAVGITVPMQFPIPDLRGQDGRQQQHSQRHFLSEKRGKIQDACWFM